MTPEQQKAVDAAIARIKEKAASEEVVQQAVDPNRGIEKVKFYDSFNETGLKAIRNIVPSFKNLGSDLYEAAQHPVESLQEAANMGAGALEAGARTIGLDKPINRLGEMMGLPPSDPTYADKVEGIVSNFAKHPITTMAEDPALPLTAILSKGVRSGIAAREAAKLAETPQFPLKEAITRAEKSVEAAKAKLAEGQYTVNTKALRAHVLAEAKKEGYNPGSPVYEANNLATDTLMKYKNNESYKILDQIKAELGMLKGPKTPDAVRMAKVMQKAVDSFVEANKPKLYKDLTDLATARGKVETVRTLVQILESGKLKAKLGGTQGKAVKKEIVNTLGKRPKSVDETTAAKLKEIADTPTEKATLSDQFFGRLMGKQGIMSAIGGSLGGYPGAVIGGALGEGIERIGNAKRSTSIIKELEKLTKQTAQPK